MTAAPTAAPMSPATATALLAELDARTFRNLGLMLWLDRDEPGPDWAWECASGPARSDTVRGPDLADVLARSLARTPAPTEAPDTDTADTADGGAAGGDPVGDRLAGLAAALPRTAVVFDTGDGDADHWPEISLTLWIHPDGTREWRVEFLAMDQARNCFEQGPDLLGVLTRITARLDC